MYITDGVTYSFLSALLIIMIVIAGETRTNWQWVAARVCEVSGAGRKTPSQCKMRWERILNPGVKRGLWTKQEDEKLKEVAAAMEYKWSHVSLSLMNESWLVVNLGPQP